MMTSKKGPKVNPKASKKNKKSWRKNVDLEDVEAFLEDKRLEERLQVEDIREKKDAELFVLDDRGHDEVEVEVKRGSKELKCFQHLTVKSGAKDPKKGRNRVKTESERKNPILRNKKTNRSLKLKMAANDRKMHLRKKEAEMETRMTRRRIKFDFDLWADEGQKNSADLEWAADEVKKHNVKRSRKVPDDFLAKTSDLGAVEAPHSGSSYNPSLSDHRDLLWRAAEVEVKKEKAERKIDFHTTKMFPKNYNREKVWMEEMAEGINDRGQDEGHGDDDDDDDDVKEVAVNKVKTKKQRRKQKMKKSEEEKKNREKEEKMKNQDVFRLKSMKRMISAQEQRTRLRQAKKAEMKAEKRKTASRLSAHVYEEPEQELKLGEELTGDLRSLRPEGSLLEDRFKSLQKRNVIAPSCKNKSQRNPHKRKFVEKRSYKMGWEKMKKKQ